MIALTEATGGNQAEPARSAVNLIRMRSIALGDQVSFDYARQGLKLTERVRYGKLFLTGKATSGQISLASQRLQSPVGRGARADFDRLYREYWSELCNRLRHRFGGGPPDPEDAVQAAFAKFAALEDPERIRNPRAFLLSTARNIILDHRRRDGRHAVYYQSVLAEHSSLDIDELTPERVVLQRERFDIVRRAITKLPRKQQIILSLSRRYGYTYSQIAKTTGWSYGDVHRQMSAALGALSDALKRG